MTIPAFGPSGFLPPGLWECTPEEFIDGFCEGRARARFLSTIRYILDFAAGRGSHHILIGGSFISSKPEPNDLDCVVIFDHTSQIPDRTERLEIDGTKLDIFFCALTQAPVLATFRALLSQSRAGTEVGVIQINLERDGARVDWDSYAPPEEEALATAKAIYINRHIVNRNPSNKALVTIHGIMSTADWNAEIALIASSNGWIIAPFHYGYVEPTVFLDAAKRRSIIDRFRDHIFYIKDRYGSNISVIAHSYGTYVACKYLFGFDRPPVHLDTLILTGSIINEKLDIDSFLGRAYQVINEVAPNDSVVKYARPASLWDSLVGRSGEVGFKNNSALLMQNECDIFDHSNVIRRDVISQRWMPALEANVGLGSQEAYLAGPPPKIRFVD